MVFSCEICETFKNPLLQSTSGGRFWKLQSCSKTIGDFMKILRKAQIDFHTKLITD